VGSGSSPLNAAAAVASYQREASTSSGGGDGTDDGLASSKIETV
jgi:hypothetical protein